VFTTFYPNLSPDLFYDHFSTHFIATQSFCLLLDFIYQHSPNLVRKLAPPIFENHTDKLILANHTLKQLNITDDSRHTGKLRSVCSFLNNCVSNMGKRRFMYNLHNPTTNIQQLNQSYAITDYLLHEPMVDKQDKPKYKLWELMRSHLTELKDIEKLNRKLILHKITPKDFSLLARDLQVIADLHTLTSADPTVLDYMKKNDVKQDITKDCIKIITDLKTVFSLDKCAQINELSYESLATLNLDLLTFINKNVNPQLDLYMQDTFDEKEKLEAIRLFFSNILKNPDFIKTHDMPKSDTVLLGTNKRIDALKTQLNQMIKTDTTNTNTTNTTNKSKKMSTAATISYFSTYSQKNESFLLQLDNLEYHTIGSNKKDTVITNPQIKQISAKIQTSKDKLIEEIVSWYNTFLDSFSKYESEIESIINYTCLSDLLQAKCYIAYKYNYCKPIIQENEQNEIGPNEIGPNEIGPNDTKAFLSFTGIRHPLIEQLQIKELYVTNDLTMGKSKDTLTNSTSTNSMNGLLLYGTNAVGKTSFIKSIGIAVIMAQAGLFVPCKTFTFFPYSSIFTRILGNDNIFKGLSTFAVEMTELRTILTLSDRNSLVLGDELCSGTESDSALSIFTAGLELLHRNECTFLFATHFHEIINYSEIKKLSKLKMMHMEVRYNKESGKLFYDRKLRDGPGDRMYGLEVCKSLNLPSLFLERAHEIRMKYNPEQQNILSLQSSHFNAKKIVGNCEMCHSEVKGQHHHTIGSNNDINTVNNGNTVVNNGNNGNNVKASEVHHLQYQKFANKEQNNYINGTFHKNHPANLINICEECHLKIHQSNNQKKIVKTINDGNYMIVDIENDKN
jgi:DNA mismatch repair protein MutS